MYTAKCRPSFTARLRPADMPGHATSWRHSHPEIFSSGAPQSSCGTHVDGTAANITRGALREPPRTSANLLERVRCSSELHGGHGEEQEHSRDCCLCGCGVTVEWVLSGALDPAKNETYAFIEALLKVLVAPDETVILLHPSPFSTIVFQ